MLFSIVAVPNCIPVNSVGGVSFLYTLTSQSLFCEWSLYSDASELCMGSSLSLESFPSLISFDHVLSCSVVSDSLQPHGL